MSIIILYALTGMLSLLISISAEEIAILTNISFAFLKGGGVKLGLIVYKLGLIVYKLGLTVYNKLGLIY